MADSKYGRGQFLLQACLAVEPNLGVSVFCAGHFNTSQHFLCQDVKIFRNLEIFSFVGCFKKALIPYFVYSLSAFVKDTGLYLTLL